MAKPKIQKNVQMHEDVSDWLDTIELTSSSTRSRVVMAGFLSLAVRSDHERKLLFRLATMVDTGILTWDQAMAYARNNSGRDGLDYIDVSAPSVGVSMKTAGRVASVLKE